MGAVALTCSSADQDTKARRPAAFQTLYNSAYRVEVASTTFGPGLPGVRAYHSSVRVDDIEYSFSIQGVTQAIPWFSHSCYANKPTVTYMGLTSMSGEEMLAYLVTFFQRGSYDLLRKNCNSFADCALFCLLDLRLDPRCRGLEKIGHAADQKAGIVQVITDGGYRPNPLSDNFDVEKVVRHVNRVKADRGFR
mmetsp:Transcript_1328/g.3277  ORF Transcript_1328/g.3277 Transcript_1328/m.3277 type:complete len:193 (+) Transcript_1328:129-707(+)